MRRHERRRGARVTGDADFEGVAPRKFSLESADGLVPPAGDNPSFVMLSGKGTPRGSEAVSSLTLRVHGNQGDPDVGPQAVGTRGRV